jgi:hypothetical protein
MMFNCIFFLGGIVGAMADYTSEERLVAKRRMDNFVNKKMLT